MSEAKPTIRTLNLDHLDGTEIYPATRPAWPITVPRTMTLEATFDPERVKTLDDAIEVLARNQGARVVPLEKLRNLEWSGNTTASGYPACPVCGVIESLVPDEQEPHAGDCWLGGALR